MKRLCLLFIILSFILLLPTDTINVGADFSRGKYLRVIDDKTPFFRNTFDSNPLFYLPYTYYVKVINEENGYLHVECYGDNYTPTLDGYVPSTMLFDDGLAVYNPYLNLTVTTISTTPFYSDSNLTNRSQYIFKDRTLSYYGHYEINGKIIYYVGYNDKLGYVEESFLTPFTITNHPNELTFLVPDIDPEIKEEQQEDGKNDQSVSLKIAIIVCLIFAGIIAFVFVLKNVNEKPVKAEYYDQNEFE